MTLALSSRARRRWLHAAAAGALAFALSAANAQTATTLRIGYQKSASLFEYGVAPLTPAVAAEQQKIADVFVDLKLIPKPIRIVDALPARSAP